jgi:hypothetical protein
VVFAQDRRRWGYLSRYVNMSRPDGDSRYRIRLPPGDYRAVAVDGLEDGEWSDPEFLQRVADRAVAFAVDDGDQKQIGLRLMSLPRK